MKNEPDKLFCTSGIMLKERENAGYNAGDITGIGVELTLKEGRDSSSISTGGNSLLIRRE